MSNRKEAAYERAIELRGQLADEGLDPEQVAYVGAIVAGCALGGVAHHFGMSEDDIEATLENMSDQIRESTTMRMECEAHYASGEISGNA